VHSVRNLVQGSGRGSFPVRVESFQINISNLRLRDVTEIVFTLKCVCLVVMRV
jgi:hypothetical protein